MDDGSSLIGALIVFVAFILVNGSLYGFGAAIQKVSEADVEKKARQKISMDFRDYGKPCCNY